MESLSWRKILCGKELKKVVPHDQSWVCRAAACWYAAPTHIHSNTCPLNTTGAPEKTASRLQMEESHSWWGSCCWQVWVECLGPCRSPDLYPLGIESLATRPPLLGFQTSSYWENEVSGLWGMQEAILVVFRIVTGTSKNASQRFSYSHSKSHQVAFRNSWYFSSSNALCNLSNFYCFCVAIFVILYPLQRKKGQDTQG